MVAKTQCYFQKSAEAITEMVLENQLSISTALRYLFPSAALTMAAAAAGWYSGSRAHGVLGILEIPQLRQ